MHSKYKKKKIPNRLNNIEKNNLIANKIILHPQKNKRILIAFFFRYFFITYKKLCYINLTINFVRNLILVLFILSQTAESLLRHGNGQYSSFDMAQYVFWTGDEAGVARAVEELIQQDLVRLHFL